MVTIKRYGIPDYLYSVVDETDNKDLGHYDELTGGELQISMVSYNQVDDKGGSATRYLPGQTSFAPVTLKTALSEDCEALYQEFLAISEGKVKRRNFTITMIDQNGHDRVIWDLLNAMPIAIGGFEFNRGYVTSFKVTIQAETIKMSFPPPPPPPPEEE